MSQVALRLVEALDGQSEFASIHFFCRWLWWTAGEWMQETSSKTAIQAVLCMFYGEVVVLKQWRVLKALRPLARKPCFSFVTKHVQSFWNFTRCNKKQTPRRTWPAAAVHLCFALLYNFGLQRSESIKSCLPHSPWEMPEQKSRENLEVPTHYSQWGVWHGKWMNQEVHELQPRLRTVWHP